MGTLLHSERLSDVHPRIGEFASYAALRMPCDLSVGAGRRSFDEQAALYAQGRSAGGSIVTNAKPGESPHNYGLAADFYPILSGRQLAPDSALEWEMLGDLISRFNTERALSGVPLVWGGAFLSLKDRPHVELSDWRSFLDWNTRTAATAASSPSSSGTGAKAIAATGAAGLLGLIGWLALG